MMFLVYEIEIITKFLPFLKKKNTIDSKNLRYTNGYECESHFKH